MNSGYYLMFLALFIKGSVNGLDCPDKCICADMKLDDGKKGLQVLCNDTGLTEIPKDIPSDVKFLDLTRNDITTVEADQLKGLSKLAVLALIDNGIEEIVDGAFSELEKLEILDLTENNINEVTDKTFTGLTSVKKIILRDNLIEKLDDNTFDGLAKTLKKVNIKRTPLCVKEGKEALQKRFPKIKIKCAPKPEKAAAGPKVNRHHHHHHPTYKSVV